MWRPKEVVPQHRHRAVLIWTVLIATILSYSVLLLYRGVHNRQNPNTSFTLSNEIYTYPDLWVCLYNNYGCDKMEMEEECIMSISNTEGGPTTATYRPGDANETTINFEPTQTDSRGWCVVFETSALEYKLGENRDPDDYIDYALLDMYWYPGGAENNSTTCIQEEGAWKSHYDNVFAFLNDPLTGEVSAGIQIPYSCMTNESSGHYFTYVGIGVSQEHNLAGSEKASYNALTLGTVEYKVERNDDITGIQAPYAYMKMELQQESDSMVSITEIDPLNMAEILGQGNEVRIRLFEDHGLVTVTKATSRLATLLLAEFEASYLRRGAPEKSLKQLLPANTFLVTVPPNATALSVATRIERHCVDCSEQTNSEQVVVKVTRVSCSIRQSQALEATSYLSAGDHVNESVVEAREEWVGRRFAPAYSDEGSSQPRTRPVLQRINTLFRWSSTPEAVLPPIRRPPPASRLTCPQT